MKKIFVHGIFNILHPGHLRLLKFAKECGDYLTVGVYPDKRINNKNTFNEKIRLESIKSTNYVDESFILKNSELDYIKSNKPDIVVKGREHKNLNNEEENILNQYGGKLLFTSGDISFSSFDLIERSLNSFNYSHTSHSYNFINRHNIQKNKLLEIIENFSKLNVLVIGDTIVDEYISCDPIGMSQEDATIVVSPISSQKFIGGAAIVASHAKTLGAKVSYISVIGEDENSLFVNNYLEELNINTYLQNDSTRCTTLKQRFRANGKTLLRVNHLKQHQLTSDLENKILTYFNTISQDLDIVIFSDFSYGVLSNNIIDKISEIAHNNHIKVVADSQSSSQVGDISKFKNMYIVTPTEREIRLALNDFESGLVVLGEKLSNKSNPKYICTTLGSEGIMIYNSDKNNLLTDNIPALNHNPKDISGAGDSLLVCAALALSSEANIWESSYLGSIAASIQVSRIGNIPILKDEIIQEISKI